ncbi:hypothetical protein [Imhoffiella purpurea]|uniref:Uncharacterized protein n=1 Tax=Imhoffiella purpurea TaxID=1249627 RepID=W9V873_9GAMM|nr:hypothetical protein [Imhoffiella purpurea]EXJ12277.1 hypothetical protein D779_4072 [Imhoffiella purpurea]
MQTLERLSQLPTIVDPVMRAWIAQRWREVLESGTETSFVLLSPSDPLLESLWSVCFGDQFSSSPSWEELDVWIEYVVDQGSFYEVVILPNQEASLIALVPKGDAVSPILSIVERGAYAIHPGSTEVTPTDADSDRGRGDSAPCRLPATGETLVTRLMLPYLPKGF